MPFADPETRFTFADIVCEAGSELLSLHIFAAIAVITTGIAYNRAKDSGDQARIDRANANLHHDLYTLKKNHLDRFHNGHWFEK